MSSAKPTPNTQVNPLTRPDPKTDPIAYLTRRYFDQVQAGMKAPQRPMFVVGEDFYQGLAAALASTTLETPSTTPVSHHLMFKAAVVVSSSQPGWDVEVAELTPLDILAIEEGTPFSGR